MTKGRCILDADVNGRSRLFIPSRKEVVNHPVYPWLVRWGIVILTHHPALALSWSSTAEVAALKEWKTSLVGKGESSYESVKFIRYGSSVDWNNSLLSTPTNAIHPSLLNLPIKIMWAQWTQTSWPSPLGEETSRIMDHDAEPTNESHSSSEKKKSKKGKKRKHREDVVLRVTGFIV